MVDLLHPLAGILSLEEGSPAGTRGRLKWWANSSVCDAREEITLNYLAVVNPVSCLDKDI